MSKIRIQRAHGLGTVSEAMAFVAPIEEKLKEKYGVTLSWSGQSASIKGTGLSGEFSVDDTNISVEVKLGFLLKPMARKIEEGIANALDHHINE